MVAILLSDGTSRTDVENSANAGFDIFDETNDYDKRPNGAVDASDFIVDVREYDVPYHVRVAIDKGLLFYNN
jgi:DNA polymerase elongation subunit (family B)